MLDGREQAPSIIGISTVEDVRQREAGEARRRRFIRTNIAVRSVDIIAIDWADYAILRGV